MHHEHRYEHRLSTSVACLALATVLMSGIAVQAETLEENLDQAGFSSLSIGRHAVHKIYLGELEAGEKKSAAFVKKLDQMLSASGFIVVSLRQNADVMLTGSLDGAPEGAVPVLKLQRPNGDELMHMEVPGEVDCSGRCQSKTAAAVAQNIKKHWKEGQVFPDRE